MGSWSAAASRWTRLSRWLRRSPTTLDGRRISFFDIDIDPQGQLVGISSNQLIQLEMRGEEDRSPGEDTLANINGLAIDSEGTIFLTQSSGRPAQAYTLTMDGRLDSLGDLTPYASSGDCVVLKDDSLLMTSRNPEGGNDLLVYVDSRSAQTRLIGTMGAACTRCPLASATSLA